MFLSFFNKTKKERILHCFFLFNLYTGTAKISHSLHINTIHGFRKQSNYLPSPFELQNSMEVSKIGKTKVYSNLLSVYSV